MSSVLPTIRASLTVSIEGFRHLSNTLLRNSMDPTDGIIKLLALDQIMPCAYTPFPLTFAIEPNDVPAALSILQRGFEQLAHEIPLLGGYLIPTACKSEVHDQALPLAAQSASPRLFGRYGKNWLEVPASRGCASDSSPWF